MTLWAAEKKEIENMAEITLKQQDVLRPGAEEVRSEPEKIPPVTAEPSQKTKSSDEGNKKSLNTEAEKRLAWIIQRKTELMADREKLSNVREQLALDVKNAGVIRSREKGDEMNRRIAELDAKILKFNEEVKRLNDEEKKIIDSLSK